MCLNQGYIKERVCTKEKKKSHCAEFKWQLSHISNGEQTNLELRTERESKKHHCSGTFIVFNHFHLSERKDFLEKMQLNRTKSFHMLHIEEKKNLSSNSS